MANQRERIKKAGYPAELYHDGGFMPYVPELPIGRAVYNTYFRGGAEYWLDGGKPIRGSTNSSTRCSGITRNTPKIKSASAHG